MAGVRFEDVDLLGALSRIVDLHTQHYKDVHLQHLYCRFFLARTTKNDSC